MKPSIARHIAGFTLIETMIATAVAGVLASVAYPSLAGALQKIRRSEALVAMIQVQQAQERWRSASASYGTLTQIGLGAAAPGGNYLLSVSAASASGYIAFAQASGAQAGDRACRYLKLSVDGGDASYTSGETEAASNGAQANRQCWNQ